jgi:hypothetical protein
VPSTAELVRQRMRPHHSADPRLSLLLVLVILGALAWLTRHPDSAAVRRAEHWPAVGPLASRLRAAYAPRPPGGDSIAGDVGPDHRAGQVEVVVESVDPERVSARPQIWLEPTTRVRISPQAGSEVLATVEALGNYSLVERRGDWFHVHRTSMDHRVLDGWVWLPEYEEPSSEQLQRPEPVLPMAAVPPDQRRVERARSFMVGGGIEIRCGPYVLHTDVQSGWTLSHCGQLAEQMEGAYRVRYGLAPIGRPAEAILLFRSWDAYRRFIADQPEIPATRTGHASPARGYVGLYVGDLPQQAVASTLVHELTHLINRRALGPALPPWLSEGLADDLAESRIDEAGYLRPGELGGFAIGADSAIQRFGGAVSALLLVDALDDHRLPGFQDLVEMGSEEFRQAPEETLLYALSSFWIRFLLSEAPGSRPQGLRAFLRAVSEGQVITTDLLLQSLGGDWQQLELDFRSWLRVQAAPLPGLVNLETP